jgi:hypothetical protein
MIWIINSTGSNKLTLISLYKKKIENDSRWIYNPLNIEEQNKIEKMT